MLVRQMNGARQGGRILTNSGMDSQTRRARLKRAARWLGVLGILYLMLRWFEHSQVYQPFRKLEASPTEMGRAFEDVRFKTGDGVELHGWFFPADTNSPRAQLAFLICHGNAGNISHRLGLCAALLKTGASVFVFDYRGYGNSAGRPGEEGTYRDAQAAHAWLRQKGFRGEHSIAFGESLGGGVVSELALRETLGGVVLQSTFTSLPEIGAEVFPWLPVRWISTIKYDTHAKLPRIHVPVLVMHSRADDLARFQHAEKNFAAANEPKFFCELNGAHNDAAWESPAFHEAIEKLLKRLEQPNPGQ
jgi:alpha-beta hydrolase superfamily lysophospholipase